MMDRLALIRSRLSMIAVGPWTRDSETSHVRAASGLLVAAGHICDMEFIAHAPQDIAWLLGELAEQRVLGHGEGQEHAIADVNAGRVDDLIAPRLSRDCQHEWEQVWLEWRDGEMHLTGGFRCRKCRNVKPESADAVDPHAGSTGKLTTRVERISRHPRIRRYHPPHYYCASSVPYRHQRMTP